MSNTIVNDSWNSTNGFWDDATKWSVGVPNNGDDAEIGGGNVTISSPQQQEANFVSVGGTGGAPAEATLTTNGTLTTGSMNVGNATVNGGGTINAVLFQQGSFFLDDDDTYSSVMTGSLNVVADTVEVGGGGDKGFAVDQNATLTAIGTSTIYQGFLTGNGTLQNGTLGASGAAMTFANSDDGNTVTNGSPFNNATTIGSFINWGTTVFTGTLATYNAESFTASSLTNNGIIQLGTSSSSAPEQDGDVSAASFVNDGNINILSGTATIGESTITSLSGIGNILIAGNARLIIKPNARVGGSQFISFNNEPGGSLQIDGTAAALAASFQGQIEEYTTGNIIDLQNVALSSITAIGPNAANTAITVTTSAGPINFAVDGGPDPAEILVASSNGGNGTNLTFAARPAYDNFTNSVGDFQWATAGNWSITYGGVPTLADNATISSANVTIAAAQTEQAGSLTLNNGAELIDQGSLFLENAMTIGSGQIFYLDGGSLSFSDSTSGVTVDPGGLFKGGAGVDAFEDTLTDNGTVEATPSQTLDLFNVTGSGTLQIDSGATLESNAGSSLTADFNGANAELDYSYLNGNFNGPTLANLRLGDSISLGGFGIGTPAYTIAGNSLTISSGAGAATFALANPPAGLEFLLTEAGYDNLIATATDDIPPMITAPGAAVATAGVTSTISGISVVEPDPSYTGITLAVSLIGAGALSMIETGTGIGAPVSGTDLTITGTQQEIDNDLNTLKYISNSNTPEIVSIALSAHNNGPDDYNNQAIAQTIAVATVPADDITAQLSGDWSSAATWLPMTVPSVADYALVTGPYDVTVSDAESVNVLSILSSQSEVDISGTLSLGNNLSEINVEAGGTLGLFGGTILGNGGILNLNSGNLVSEPYSFSEGALDGLTVSGVLNVTGNLTIQDGFSIVSANGVGPGEINVSLPQDGFNPITLYFAGTYTLRDTYVTLKGANGYAATLYGDDLTIGENSTVTEVNGGEISGTIVTNDGTIIAGSTEVGNNNGVSGSAGGGVFTNSGSIIVNSGIFGISGTFQNAGSMTVNNGGLNFGQSGLFTNTGSITVDNGTFDVGNPFVTGGTFDNTGTITVENSGTLFIASGASVSSLGIIIGAGDSTIELAGTITDSGTFYYGDPATLILDDPASFGGVIGGFGAGDILELTGETITAASISNDLLFLTLSNDTTQTFNVTPGQEDISFSETSYGALQADAPCFAAGTRILTSRGALVPVENLQIGDELELFSGAAAPVLWIGRRALDLYRHPRPDAVQPVCVSAGALGRGLPWRDLIVSPDHAFYVEGHLIPAKSLLNGFSIRQLERAHVTYYHIELSEHAVLFAEGTPAESYLETGNRMAFENGRSPMLLHPDFALSLRVTKSCAPFAESGPVVEAVRQDILDRAGIETTEDPDLRICYQNGAGVISSRSAIPGEICADPRDRRRLGVKLKALHAGRQKIPLNHPALTEGWHDPEPDGRWTDGRAVIPQSILAGRNLKLTLTATLRYPATKRARLSHCT